LFVKIVKSWNSYLEGIDDTKKDIYYYEEYVKLLDGDNARCIILEEDNDILLMPFIMGYVEDFYDFETPYGYGGPITTSNNQEWIDKALEELKQYFIDQRYLAGFIRFHPLLNNQIISNNKINVLFDRNTIAIDSSVDENKIWMNQISSKNRNMIRKATKAGLVFERDDNFKYMDEFVALYKETMDRLGADDFYLFPDDYYDKFKQNMKGSAFIGVIKKDDTIVSAALFFYGDVYAHYHLAGSIRDKSTLGANNLLLWNACKIFSEMGIKKFHLGGGTDSDSNNSLLKFKRSFSNDVADFNIGKMVFNETEYKRICDNWIKKNPQKENTFSRILLKYRY
jgi:lipid II:glycine glycyltransferase (peptidoglycan interpeptide bridge formation enzyme)